MFSSRFCLFDAWQLFRNSSLRQIVQWDVLVSDHHCHLRLIRHTPFLKAKLRAFRNLVSFVYRPFHQSERPVSRQHVIKHCQHLYTYINTSDLLCLTGSSDTSICTHLFAGFISAAQCISLQNTKYTNIADSRRLSLGLSNK